MAVKNVTTVHVSEKEIGF